MRKPSATTRAKTTPTGSSSRTCSTHSASAPSSLANASSCPRTTTPRWTCSIFPRHNYTSIDLNYFYYIGGSPHIPELQVGQLGAWDSTLLEPVLKNEEISRFGFELPHLGQVNFEPSSPRDLSTSNLPPHLGHWYSYIGMVLTPLSFPAFQYAAEHRIVAVSIPVIEP